MASGRFSAGLSAERGNDLNNYVTQLQHKIDELIQIQDDQQNMLEEQMQQQKKMMADVKFLIATNQKVVQEVHYLRAEFKALQEIVPHQRREMKNVINKDSSESTDTSECDSSEMNVNDDNNDDLEEIIDISSSDEEHCDGNNEGTVEVIDISSSDEPEDWDEYMEPDNH